MLKKEVGLSALTGALVVSWFGAGLPALHASAVATPVEYYNNLPVSVENADQDRDGVPDYIDASPHGKRAAAEEVVVVEEEGSDEE